VDISYKPIIFHSYVLFPFTLEFYTSPALILFECSLLLLVNFLYNHKNDMEINLVCEFFNCPFKLG